MVPVTFCSPLLRLRWQGDAGLPHTGHLPELSAKSIMSNVQRERSIGSKQPETIDIKLGRSLSSARDQLGNSTGSKGQRRPLPESDRIILRRLRCTERRRIGVGGLDQSHQAKKIVPYALIAAQSLDQRMVRMPFLIGHL